MSPKLGTYCGSNPPGTFRSQGSVLLLEYVRGTNSAQVGGFNVSYRPAMGGCGGTFHDSVRTIETPQYPLNYPNNAECLWELRAAEGYTIQLKPSGRFHLEDSENCTKDFVEVWDWIGDIWVTLGRRCGRQLLAFNSTANKMRVLFRSDNITTFQGFAASWSMSCGGTFKADSIRRYIVSPGYPEGYSGNLVCTYTIASENKYLHITFEDFMLESSSGCKYDNVTIMPNRYTNIYGPRTVFCGENTPPRYKIFKTFTMTFRTDSTLNKKGFRMAYRVEECGGTVTKEEEIMSPNQTWQYNFLYSPYGLRDQNCVWNITAPQGRVVVLE